MSESDVVEVVVIIDGIPEAVVVFVLNVDVVEGLVYDLVVVGLDALYVRQHQRQLSDLVEGVLRQLYHKTTNSSP